MPSGAPPHVALEGEPVHKGSPSYSVALWSLGLTPWPLTPETLHSAGSSRWSYWGQGPGVSEGITHEERGPSEKQGELY